MVAAKIKDGTITPPPLPMPNAALMYPYLQQ